jgi:hypothetical protein
MKILAVSDSHRKIENLLRAVSAEKPDMILHMGDYAADTDVLAENCPDIPVRRVRGNCDGAVREKDTDEFIVEGKRFFITHGHLFGVKRSTDSLMQQGLCAQADVVLYGHTHYQDMTSIGSMIMLNPGSIGYDRDYAVLELENGDIKVHMKHLIK